MSVLSIVIILLITKKLLCTAEDVGFRIIGGDVCDYKDYPFLVHVFSYYNCEGTLIHEEWVLTAAQCFIKHPSRTDIRETVVHAGGNGGEEDLQSRKAVFQVAHPKFDAKYDSGDMNNDIGLIRIESPFRVTPWVRAVPLPKSSKRGWSLKFNVQWGLNKPTKPKYPCLNPTIIGTGSVSTQDFWMPNVEALKTRKLKCAETHFVPNEVCTKIRKELNPDSTFCISDEHNSGCGGDNGGPLICKNVGVVGVFSITLTNCENGTAVITRIDYYRNWIDEIVTGGKKSSRVSKKSGHSGSNKIFLWDSCKMLVVCVLLSSKFLKGN